MSISYDTAKSAFRNLIDAAIAVANAEEAYLTDVLFVDGDRTDSYTADGSMAHPYKTIAAANTAAVSGDVIIVAPGAYAETVSITSGAHLFGWNVTGATLTGESIIFNGSTIDFSANLVMENGEIIKNDTDGQVDVIGNLDIAPGTTGGLITKISEATATLSGASTTIQINVPTGSLLLGVQLRVDTLITSGDGATSWDAAYSGGSTQAITTGQAFAKQTKVNKPFDANGATAIAASEVDIAITPDSNTFSGGVVRAIAYYQVFDDMADAA